MNDEIYQSLFEIVTFFNRPKQDRLLLKKARVELDKALFPIIMRVGEHQKIGIVKLADELGRDHSTVSRQVDKLEAAGLLVCGTPNSDGRLREVRLTDRGKEIEERIIAARQLLMGEALADWNDADLAALQSSLERLARSLAARKEGK